LFELAIFVTADEMKQHQSGESSDEPSDELVRF